MEVGAVKQAFNNEVILLKKNLNQAKIQIIHKLTRKAKTLNEKKVPENIKLKFTKKAESAVKEVLIIKKIKARDIARFIVTHKGQLNEHLNKPTVDLDKACARLLLHKALQDKYKLLRDKFSNIPIKDLLMSRQERLKLKKEERDKQKNKKKAKNSKELVQTKEDWDVEDINMEESPLDPTNNDKESLADEHNQDNDVESAEDDRDQDNDDEDDDSDEDDKSDESVSDVVSKHDILLKNNVSSSDEDRFNKEASESNDEVESDNGCENPDDFENTADDSEESGDNESTGKFVQIASNLPNDNIKTHKKDAFQDATLEQTDNKKKVEKKHKDHNKNKNKNLKNKILLNKFNKEKSEMLQETKIVDPFFITATGENYMSVAEPRQPDEIKEEHNQGNRKYRRAVMFGHVPKTKLRRNGYQPDKNNSRFSKSDENNSRGSFNPSFKSNSFDKHGPHKRFDNSTDSSNMGNFKNRQSNNFKSNVEEESKPEKLHPSWEAKKRQSGILPFQGKKIVFDEG